MDCVIKTAIMLPPPPLPGTVTGLTPLFFAFFITFIVTEFQLG